MDRDTRYSMLGPGVRTSPSATTAMPRPAPALIMPASLPAGNHLPEGVGLGCDLGPQAARRPAPAVVAAKGGDIAVAASAPPERLEPAGQLDHPTVSSLGNSPSHA